MQVISEAEFRKRLKNGTDTGYLFYGEEDYLKSHALSLISKAVCPDETSAFFDSSKIDYLDYSAEKLRDKILPPPMMSKKKLIVLQGFDFGSVKSGETDDLCSALSLLKNYEYNTVVLTIASGCIDEGYSAAKPSAIINKLSEFLIPVRFEKSTPQKLAAWAGKHFEHGGITADEKTLEFFISYCGTSMYKLANETEKLCAYLGYHGKTSLSEEDIRSVSVADTEFDTFALAGAIMEGRSSVALAVLDFLKFKRTDPIIIFGEISKTFCDLLMVKRLTEDGMSPYDIGKAKLMNEYRAKIYARSASKISYGRLHSKIRACTEADRLLKQGSGGYYALEMIICSDKPG